MKLLVALLLILGVTSPSPTSAQRVNIIPQVGSPVPTLSLPGDDQTFTGYDFRQSDFGDVDWPVAFVFRGNATVSAIQEGLCRDTRSPWKYCSRGGDMYLYHAGLGVTDTDRGFVANRGVKRFNENCSTTSFTAHMRLYALRDAEGVSRGSPRASQARVVGTAHLDFEDRGGCAGRIHGYPDVAEQWFLETMASIDGWKVTSNAWNLGNASKPYIVMRKVGGVEVPHVYGQDGLATDVYLR